MIYSRLLSSVAIIGLLTATSGTAHAGNNGFGGGILGGVVGGLIGQAIVQPRPAPVYVAPAQPVYVPVPVYQQAPQSTYYDDAPRPARKAAVAATPVATVSKLTKADTAAIDELKNTLLPFGAPDDIIVLIAAHDTPRVIRDLSGIPQFVHPAEGCFPFKFMKSDPSTPMGRFLVSVMDGVKKRGGRNVSMAPCTAKNFGQFDILVFTPDQMDPATNPDIRADQIGPIIEAVKGGAYTQYGDRFTKADFEAEAQARADTIAHDDEVRGRAQAEAMHAFKGRLDATELAAISMKSPATNICVVGTAETAAMLTAHKMSVFADLFSATTTVLAPLEAGPVFMAVKQHDCDAIVGSTADLRKVIPALERDNIVFDYHAGSVTTAEVKAYAEAAPVGAAPPAHE